jgi:hypothetical protein
MRILNLLKCIGLAPVFLAGCESTGPELDEVTFRLNGVAQSRPFGIGHLVGSRLFLSTEDWDSFGRLQFVVDPVVGPRTVPISPFDSISSVSLRSLQGTEYDTRLYGGRGRFVVTGYQCRTSTGTDPVTGAYGTRTFCTVAGTFEFSAKSEAGDSVIATQGRFRVSSVQRY